jgi:hypothetical protein
MMEDFLAEAILRAEEAAETAAAREEWAAAFEALDQWVWG